MRFNPRIILFLVGLLIFNLTAIMVSADEDVIPHPISFHVQMLPWEQVDAIIPNKSKFTIIDIETGLSFQVQRRAGRYHADVQPLTSEDTAIMKKIYKGEWSWNRKAVYVQKDDQLLAGSMTGMPHGAGALKNNFNGHFCLHFFGSKTHTTKKVDLAHQLMVKRAAGKLESYLSQIGPQEIIEIFTVAINQDDQDLLEMVVSNSICSVNYHEFLKNVNYFRAFYQTNSNENKREFLFAEIPLTVRYITPENKLIKKEMDYVFHKNILLNRWQIDSCVLKSM